MKKALLCLGPLACLALACLYAFAWSAHCRFVVAFERIDAGMNVEKAMTIIGRPADGTGHGCMTDGKKPIRLELSLWSEYGHSYQIWSYADHIVSTSILRTEEPALDKISNWISRPSSLWAPSRVGREKPLFLVSDMPPFPFAPPKE